MFNFNPVADSPRCEAGKAGKIKKHKPTERQNQKIQTSHPLNF